MILCNDLRFIPSSLSQEDIPLYMEKQGKKLISKAFCPVIIVEDTYLQTLYDVVILLIRSYKIINMSYSV